MPRDEAIHVGDRRLVGQGNPSTPTVASGTSDSSAPSAPCEPPPRWCDPPASVNSTPRAAETTTSPALTQCRICVEPLERVRVRRGGEEAAGPLQRQRAGLAREPPAAAAPVGIAVRVAPEAQLEAVAPHDAPLVLVEGRPRRPPASSSTRAASARPAARRSGGRPSPRGSTPPPRSRCRRASSAARRRTAAGRGTPCAARRPAHQRLPWSATRIDGVALEEPRRARRPPGRRRADRLVGPLHRVERRVGPDAVLAPCRPRAGSRGGSRSRRGRRATARPRRRARRSRRACRGCRGAPVASDAKSSPKKKRVGP